jgi:hypothetical protein
LPIWSGWLWWFMIVDLCQKIGVAAGRIGKHPPAQKADNADKYEWYHSLGFNFSMNGCPSLHANHVIMWPIACEAPVISVKNGMMTAHINRHEIISAIPRLMEVTLNLSSR